MQEQLDLDGTLGDWRGAGYSEEQARHCAEQVNALMVEQGLEFDAALARACQDYPPDLLA